MASIKFYLEIKLFAHIFDLKFHIWSNYKLFHLHAFYVLFVHWVYLNIPIQFISDIQISHIFYE